jgi:phosphoglycerol transferase MdoB-like AlkP superfamily enzyme
MLIKMKLPKTLLWVVNLLGIYILMFTLFRLATFVAFRPDGEPVDQLLPAFLLGLRYDLRWIGLVLLPIVLISLRAEYSPFYSRRNTRIWTAYLAGATFFVIFFFAADFGCFSYNKTRLNASALNFAEDPGISAVMLWQSYPMFWLILALVVAVCLLQWMFQRTHYYVTAQTEGRRIQYRRWPFLAALLPLTLAVYGRVGIKPLTWKEAFVLQDSFRSYLALNPLQNFFTTLKFRRPEVNDVRAQKAFPEVAQWLGRQNTMENMVPAAIPSQWLPQQRPNVVLVLCESFSMYKSTMSGNPLNTTPYFDSLSSKGIFFERCFTPHFSTARGLFALLTGIPDVQLSKFSTRNPEALQQHTIINDFKEYEKMYFLGGSPKFNNFEGLLRNIEGLQMHTEGSFKAKPVNVWGISDKDLFLEANEVLAQKKAPFFAIIQTANNHRPFAIPAADTLDFPPQRISPDSLKLFGFESEGEYNAFRYADYSFRRFMEAAQKEPYFANTLFVFVGDHGVSGDARAVYPEPWTSERLTDEHVPLLFYAPGLKVAQKRTEVVSQIDVLPTIAGLAAVPYSNTTLGRDLLHPTKQNDHAFIIYHDEGQIGMATNDFYFTKNLNFQKEEVHPMPGKHFSPHQVDSIRQKLSGVTSAYYETAKWLLLNNKPKNWDSRKPGLAKVTSSR